MRILFLAERSFRNEGEVKMVLDEQNLRELITSEPALEELLKEVLQAEEKWLEWQGKTVGNSEEHLSGC